MIEILNELVNNRQILLIGIWYGLPITLILIILFFIKSSRDERGRAIIGKASTIFMIVFIFPVNFPCKDIRLYPHKLRYDSFLRSMDIRYCTYG